MRKLIVVVVLSLLAVPSFAGNGSIRRSRQPIKNSYIAVLESKADVDPGAVAEEVRAQHGIRVDSVWRLALRGFAFTGSEAAASRVSANPRVKAVWENEPTYPTGQQYPTPSWHLDRLDQRYWSWNDPTSPYYQNQTYDYYYTGAGVTAYVIDSGISPIASEFGNRILRQYNFATVNGVRDPNDFVDRCGHGTPVASILGGTAYGVAKDVNFVSLRTWGEAINAVCQGTTQDVIDALQQVIADHQQHGGLAVVNWSGRFPTIDGPGESAFKNVVEYGLPVVVSAGNDQADACTMSPGRLGHTSYWGYNPGGLSLINVSGTNQHDTFNNILNYGQCIDILGPSFDLRAMGANGSERIFGASSGAAPQVAAVAAMHLQRLATYSPTPGMIEAAIKDYSTVGVVSGNSADGTENYPDLLLYAGFAPRRRACCTYP